VASVTGFGWQLSGGQPDILWSDSQEPSQLLVGFDCPPRHRRFGTDARRAISRDNDGSFGPRQRCVLGDVGVRFGGSEHHRIDTSSSHTRPPAQLGRDSRLPGQGNRRFLIKASCAWSLASVNRSSSEHRAFGTTRDRATRPLRRKGDSVPSRYDNRSSSEPRWSRLTGGWQPAPLGALRAALHRDRESGALRSIGEPSRTWQESLAQCGRAPRPPRGSRAELLGAPHSAPHRTR